MVAEHTGPSRAYYPAIEQVQSTTPAPSPGLPIEPTGSIPSSQAHPSSPSRATRVTLLVNPRSGRGRAQLTARDTHDALSRAGYDVSSRPIGERDDPPADVLVIVGGDGTVHHSLPLAARLGIPIWQIPMGTENLFARCFGMTRSPDALVRAIAAMSVEPIDLAEFRLVELPGSIAGSSPPRPFMLMLSVGPDAGVVRRLTESRSGAIRHASYLVPVLREAFAPSLSPLTIHVDGRPIVDRRPGLLVIANSREYGVRLNPCPSALMTDGLLDLTFFPAASSLELLGWAARSRSGTHLRSSRVVHLTGRDIRVRSSERALPLQIDGEAGGLLGTNQELLVRVIPGAISVLRPAQA